MSIEESKSEDHHRKILVRHSSRRKSHQMNRRRDAEMHVAREIHLLHHRISPQDEV